MGISQPSDPLEREADRVADEVLRGPGSGDIATRAVLGSSSSTVQRKCAACEDDDKTLQRKPTEASSETTTEPLGVEAMVRSSGRALDEGVRGFFEPRFGHDFSKVRVHDNARAADAAESVKARAYTIRRDIVFGAGEYAPHTTEGRRLLAHELAHVVQQEGMPHASGQVQRAPDGEPRPAPAETSSETLEAAYRRRGDTRRADAIRRCRTERACGAVITNTQLRTLYDLARSSGGDAEKIKAGLAGPKLAFLGPLGGAAADLGTAAGATGAAAGTTGAAAGTTGGATAAGTAGGAAGVGTGVVIAGVALVAVVAVLAGVALYEEYQISKLRRALEDIGFTVLDDPLQVCIGGCHAPAAPRAPDFGRTFPRRDTFPRLPSDDQEAIRRWLEQTAPTPPTATASPTPVPAPAPAPLPPVGTGPHERRIPTQTCENQVLDALQKSMHDLCDQIPGDSCSPKKVSQKKLDRRPCSQIRQRIQAIQECIRRRQKIQDDCFGGVPDPRHVVPLADLQNALTACLALEAINCAPGHPMANQ